MKKCLLIILGFLLTISISFAQNSPLELKYSSSGKVFDYSTDIAIKLLVKLPKELTNQATNFKAQIDLQYDSRELVKINDEDRMVVDFRISKMVSEFQLLGKKHKQATTFNSEHEMIQLVLSSSGEVIDVILKDDEIEESDVDEVKSNQVKDSGVEDQSYEKVDAEETEEKLIIDKEQYEQAQNLSKQALVNFLKFYFGLKYNVLPEKQVNVGDFWIINHHLKTGKPFFSSGEDIVFPISQQLVKLKKSRKNTLAHLKTTANILFEKTIDFKELRSQALEQSELVQSGLAQSELEEIEESEDKIDVDPENNGEPENENKNEEAYGLTLSGFGDKISYKLPIHLNGDTVFDLTNGCLNLRKIEIKGIGLVITTKYSHPIETEFSYNIKIKTKRK